VFHVTNSGCSSTSTSSLFCFDLRSPNKLLRLLLLLVAELASDTRLGVEDTLGKEDVELVAGDGKVGKVRRDMAGLVGLDGSAATAGAEGSSSESSDEGSS
jgi:hypothetical protein